MNNKIKQQKEEEFENPCGSNNVVFEKGYEPKITVTVNLFFDTEHNAGVVGSKG